VANDDNYGTDEDTPLSVPAPGVLGNDTDVDGNPLTAVLAGGPSNASSFTLNANGSFDYTPNPGFTGPDPFTYRANDTAVDSNVATVTITVTAAPAGNSPPDAVNDEAALPNGRSVTIAALANDTDPNGDPLTVASVTNPSNGTAVINADDTVTYKRNRDFRDGCDSFGYTISDGNGGAAGATVFVTVGSASCGGGGPLNDPPVANDDNYGTDEDTPLSVPAPGVLGNDTDADSNPLTAVLAGAPVNASSFNLNPDGSFDYTPNPGFAGPDPFTYTANDGAVDSNVATVTITVTAAPGGNTPPTAVDDDAALPKGRSVTIDVLANDSDPDVGDVLTVVSVTNPVNDDTVTYKRNKDFKNGCDSFGYTISDGNGGAAGATVFVTVGSAACP
jgi:hypothetical protein